MTYGLAKLLYTPGGVRQFTKLLAISQTVRSPAALGRSAAYSAALNQVIQTAQQAGVPLTAQSPSP